MLLCMDIGNTNIVLGTFSPDAAEHAAPAATWRLSTRANAQADEYAVLLRQLLQLEGLTEEAIDAMNQAREASGIYVPPGRGPEGRGRRGRSRDGTAGRKES